MGTGLKQPDEGSCGGDRALGQSPGLLGAASRAPQSPCPPSLWEHLVTLIPSLAPTSAGK